MSWLPYAQQVLELERIARLELPELEAPLDRPALGEASGEGGCLVCGRQPARRCQGCGSVSYCSVEHQGVDVGWHAGVCPVLREIELDERRRDERCGLLGGWLQRPCPSLAGKVPRSWESYLDPSLAGSERRLLTDLTSRPLTLALLLQTLELTEQRRTGLVRVHVMAASHKELECLAGYSELATFWPQLQFELLLVGLELEPPIMPPAGAAAVRVGFHRGEYRRTLWSRFGAPDLIVGFNAGLLLYPSWQRTLLDVIQCGAPLALTSYRVWEAAAEARLLLQWGASCVRPVMASPFASRAARRSATLANDVSWDNSYLSVWR
jgi:hypothetical protein